jgi:hypothetical protein
VAARNRKSKYLTHQLITKRMAAADIDIYRSATEMIRAHGIEAETEATAQAAQCHAAGDDDAGAVWTRIARTIRGLIRPQDGPLN